MAQLKCTSHKSLIAKQLELQSKTSLICLSPSGGVRKTGLFGVSLEPCLLDIQYNCFVHEQMWPWLLLPNARRIIPSALSHHVGIPEKHTLQIPYHKEWKKTQNLHRSKLELAT